MGEVTRWGGGVQSVGGVCMHRLVGGWATRSCGESVLGRQGVGVKRRRSVGPGARHTHVTANASLCFCTVHSISPLSRRRRPPSFPLPAPWLLAPFPHTFPFPPPPFLPPRHCFSWWWVASLAHGNPPPPTSSSPLPASPSPHSSLPLGTSPHDGGWLEASPASYALPFLPFLPFPPPRRCCS